jgi:hypothetical protein
MVTIRRSVDFVGCLKRLRGLPYYMGFSTTSIVCNYVVMLAWDDKCHYLARVMQTAHHIGFPVG